MIGLLFLLGFGLWLTVSIRLSKRIPHWLGVTKHATVISVLLFPVVLAAPVADELIGRWQFSLLCEREAVVTLSPDWQKVKRAMHKDIPVVNLQGHVIPIRSQREEYVDIDTGKIFHAIQAFHTKGGVLFGQLGLGLGQATSCWPNDWIQVRKKVDIDQLIKQGKTK
jgi:hypothetical protein